MSESNFKKKVYVCQNRNEKIRNDSTSGGIFSAIASIIIQKSGVVFGARFNDLYEIVHDYTSSIDELIEFRGSKYVMSKMQRTYEKVKDFLDNDKYVLFTGTPCQVAGLKVFLREDYDKLYTMDLVCYSISTPDSWKLYLDYLKTHNNISLEQISRIKFRDKTKYGYEYSQMVFYNKKGKILYCSGPETDKFLRSFVSRTSTCKACFKCKYKTINRVSDFTAWDCYNIYKYNKNMDDNHGTNHLMVHTRKGESLFRELENNLIWQEVDLDKAVLSEPAMTQIAVPGKLHNSFFNAIMEGKNPFEIYFDDSFKVKIERLSRKVLSKTGLYKYVKRALKK